MILHRQFAIVTWLSNNYISMGYYKVDIRIVRIIHSTALTLSIVGRRKLIKIIACPCHNANDEHDEEKECQDDETEEICTATFLV